MKESCEKSEEHRRSLVENAGVGIISKERGNLETQINKTMVNNIIQIISKLIKN